ncbi:FecR domain-containing protein [Agrobacterium tumefaciens]|uniref:FecR family protein n=1 Tax=Agrobacterium tumefaciens TaxID=358 RepID=UPI00287C2B57|nr:FecR domain-containing protein [Agrobacterium tumefaciens]MDS7594631.1 FecR domain-containing protein [Agrobacterium tumefaciens]
MDWFLRLNEPTCTDDDKKAFTLWLNGSAENGDAWAKAIRTWQVMGAVVPAHASSGQTVPNSDRRTLPLAARSRRSGHRKPISIGIAALAACLIAFVAAPSILTRYNANYVTATAEVRRVTLEDGSTVELAGDSAIAVAFSATGRQVRLLSGQAFFDVRPDARSPFNVKTDALDVTVVGTAFDVNVTPQIETVQLAHGIINLSDAGSKNTLRMMAGDTVTLDRTSGRLSRATVDVDTIASWRERKLFVQDVPVTSVIAELQRYHKSWIAVASIELGDRRVTGLYDLSDPDRALEALVSPFGGKVHRVSPYLRVLALF